MDVLAGTQWLLRRMLVAQGVVSRTAPLLGNLIHHYQVPGRHQGTPVLLVHGLAGSANGFFRTMRSLARRIGPVFALDLPGNGFSPLPANGPLTLDGHVQVLELFCERVVGRPAFVIGNSLGGAMSIMLAAKRPELVRALGLVAPAGARVSDHRWSALAQSLRVGSAPQARALTRKLFHSTPWGLMLFAAELQKLYAAEAVTKVLAEAEEHRRLFLEPELLARLAMPTLLLWGQSEKLLPYEGIDYFRAHLPPDAHIEVVEGFGHLPQMERPAQLVERLIRFADQRNI